MQVPLAVIADFASDSNGKLNIMGIFDRIQARIAPVTHPQMQLVMILESDPTERGSTKHLEVRLIDEDGGEVFRLGGPLVVPNDARLTQRFNFIVPINMLMFPRFGTYTFVIKVNDDRKHEVTFTVERLPEPSPSPPAS